MPKKDNRIENYFKIFVYIAIILALIGVSPKIMDLYTEWGIAILISLIFAVIAETIIIRFGGESLKNVHIIVWGRRISIFTILTILVKYLFLK